MAGGSIPHSRISFDTCEAFNAALKQADQPCEVFGSDMAIYIEKLDKILYPDGSVVCDELDEHRNIAIKNPVVIIEVLSDSTEAYDRGDKFVFTEKSPLFNSTS